MKLKQKIKSKGFSEVLIKHWEKTDGINFAIALARISGWMLQIDWLTLNQHAEVENMTPIRVYVETNKDVVFDFTGKKSVIAFHKYVILPIAMKKAKTRTESVATRCYSEETLRELSLKYSASEYEIEKATSAILANPAFMSLIPKRVNPEIPAFLASQFSHGNCVPYACALQNSTGMPALGISVSKYQDECGNKLDFCHAVVLHPDGDVEDAWGKQSLQEVLDRFYIQEYRMTTAIYDEHKNRQFNEHADRYQKAYDLAISFIG